MTVVPLTPTVGAEIVGVDLSQLTDEEHRVVADAFADHLVLFFRDQRLDDRSQREVAAGFGPLQVFPFAPPLDPALPEVHAIATGAGPKTSNADTWHSDATFMECPPMATLLRAIELPGSGGDTLFANMYAAYDALSSRLQRLLEGMTATHDFTKSSSHRRRLDDQFPPVEHPVVRTHPVTGRKALFVNRVFTVTLNELTDAENELLLPLLCDHVKSPDFQCRFTWSPGSVAVWDNRCAQHYAVADYGERRVMHRVLIAGDRPR